MRVSIHSPFKEEKELFQPHTESTLYLFQSTLLLKKRKNTTQIQILLFFLCFNPLSF
ncbi:hypothetical protein LEP1GSC082_1349 [Leptospira kirschneri str. H2]|nr:hypothetical protein LEP1GSC082_1349 [Leptospira kirschneri str. H2]